MAVNLLQKLWRENGHDEVRLGAPLHAAALGVRQHLVPQARLVQTKEVHTTALNRS